MYYEADIGRNGIGRNIFGQIVLHPHQQTEFKFLEDFIVPRNNKTTMNMVDIIIVMKRDM